MVASPDPYYDLLLKSSDGKEVKWREFDCQYKMGALLSIATRSVDFGYKIQLDIPLRENTINYLIEWAEKKKGSSHSWMNLEHILLEIEGILPKVKDTEVKPLIEIKESIIDMFLKNISIDNCVGMWRLCTKLNSRSLEKALTFVLEHLLDSVIEKTIDRDYYRLTVPQLTFFLSQDRLRLREEIDVVALISAWISMHSPSRRPVLKELLSSVRADGVSTPCIQLAGLDISELTLSRARPRGISAIVVIGGWDTEPQNDMLLLDHGNGRWIRMPNSLPEMFAYHGAVLLNGELFLFGGGDDGTGYYDSAWKRTIDGVWEHLPSMRQRRCYITHTACVLDDMIWVMGGHSGRHRLRSVERFNPVRNVWEEMPPMLHPRSDAAATVINGKIFVMGGFDGRRVLSSVEVFDPRTGEWTEFTGMPAVRTGLCCIAEGSNLIVIAGFDGVERHTTMWSIDTDHPENGWHQMPSLIHARSNFSVCWYGKNILVAGGYSMLKVKKVEVFDGHRWSEAPDLPAGRSALQMVTMSHDQAMRLFEHAGRQ